MQPGLGSEITLTDDAVLAPAPVVHTGGAVRAARRPRWWWRVVRYVVLGLVGGLWTSLGVIAGALFTYELYTSALQSRLLSEYARTLTYNVDAGPSPRIVFPAGGPFDDRRGYTDLGYFQPRLGALGFDVVRQARFSPHLAELAAWGITPPYPEPPTAGLTIHGAGGVVLHGRADVRRVFERFEDIPPLLTDGLLFIENRELLTPFDSRTNPVVEWDRLGKAALLYLGGKLGFHVPMHGGSTLATQIEKYRHSPDGRTASPLDKVKQMFAASVRAYHDGPYTLGWRRQLVVDYLNSIPLAAVPGYGELYGLGDGLSAWFGLELADVVAALRLPDTTPEKVHAYKHALALAAAVQAPSKFLIRKRAALERRVNEYTRLMARNGLLEPAFAKAVIAQPLVFLPQAPVAPQTSFISQKASTAARTHLMRLLNVDNFYDLDRLHLSVDTTYDAAFQAEVGDLFLRLADPQFVAAHGLKGERLLRTGDPGRVLYSLLLFERTDAGNALRVQVDNLDGPLDINEGIKMELGSTAKLRTLAHYLELVAETYYAFVGLDAAALDARAAEARDPITKWAAETLEQQPALSLDGILQAALDRKYTANVWETFFTGGGLLTFGNFDKSDNRRILTVREALRKSTNLVFIRLMRDLVRYHEARLPYDAKAVLADPTNPVRRQLLEEIADDEGRRHLNRAYRRYRGLGLDATITKLLGKRATSPRHLAILFFALDQGGSAAALDEWLRARGLSLPPAQVQDLYAAYAGRRLTLADYAYLLSRHQIDLWTARELLREPTLTPTDLYDRSAAVRDATTDWLYHARARRAQNLRLTTRIERDAFVRMTPYWQRLAFPFPRLVPSYATAIGSSSDRPAALAEFMGIIVNDGRFRPTLRETRLHFAAGTPYETVFAPTPRDGEQVMDPIVARTLREAIRGVVEAGTARRVAGAFVGPDGKRLPVGGKTGSGDNRIETVNRWGGVTSSKATSRTATFVFYIGDRYFGVITAIVPDSTAGRYEFTSALPLAVLRLAAPVINTRLAHSEPAPVEVPQPATAAPSTGTPVPPLPRAG